MTNYNDDSNANVPDLFRPPLAPEDQPTVKKWRGRLAIALLGVVLVLGMFGVVFWQWTLTKAQLAKAVETHEKEYVEAKAKADLSKARYIDMETSMKALEARQKTLKPLIETPPAFTGARSERQLAALRYGADPEAWIREKERELRDLCAAANSSDPNACTIKDE